MKYSVLIVEDEFPAQELLKKFVSLRPELEFKGLVETSNELEEILNNNDFDLMLLDIHLHDKSSIDVIDEVDNLPYIVFATADVKFAHKAFEIGAIDYLLKPFDLDRFNEAINKFINIRQNYTPYDMYRTIKEIDGDNKYKKSHLTDDKINEIAKKILKYVESTKIYTNPKISLKTISKDLGLSTNHVSQVINQKMGKKFYDFIYEYRIKEAKKLLHDPRNAKKSILEICYSSGFNSKSVFNTVFKEFEGMTPSQYRREIHKKKLQK